MRLDQAAERLLVALARGVEEHVSSECEARRTLPFLTD